MEEKASSSIGQDSSQVQFDKTLEEFDIRMSFARRLQVKMSVTYCHITDQPLRTVNVLN